MHSAHPQSTSANKRRLLGTAAAVFALAFAASPVHAQNPSADQIINGLRPSGSVAGTTRGIRPVGPGSQPAPATAPEPSATPHSGGTARVAARPAAPPAAGPVTNNTGGAPAVNLTVIFANGSAKLTPAATHTLDELGRALSSSSLAAYKFRIEGHTDTVGSADLNKALSEERANAVVDYLVTKFNIDRGRLTPAGMGEDGLLIQTPPDTAEPRNRRVQVVNVGT